MPKNFTMSTSEDALKDNFAKLDKLKTLKVKDLLSFFEKYKESTVTQKKSAISLI